MLVLESDAGATDGVGLTPVRHLAVVGVFCWFPLRKIQAGGWFILEMSVVDMALAARS